MKKTFALILAVLTALALISCSAGGNVKEPSGVEAKTQSASSGETAPTAAPKDGEATAKPTAAPKDDDPTDAPAKTGAASDKITVEEAVLFEEQGVKITLKSYDKGSYFGPELKLLVENESGKNLTVSVDNVSVNGYMNDAMLYADVADGKKANEDMTLSDSDLEACGITTVAVIELSFHIYDSDNYQTFIDSDPIVIKTSAFEGFEYSFDDSGAVAYEADGVKIVVKGLTDESILGPGVLFYIENLSDKNITITSRDVSVNGFMVSDTFYCSVVAGKRAVDSATFLRSSLEDNNIDAIEEVEMSFHIIDSDSYRTIADSDPVRISF